MRWLAETTGVLCFRLRCHFRHRMPPRGAVLVCANHQSFLDPVLVGIAMRRRLNFLARKTLFRFGPFAWLIDTLDAIPLEKDGMGIGGVKESLRRLKREESVLIFPEGQRTPDGKLHPLQPGFLALARRGQATLLPVGIAGAFEAWPRWARWPRPGHIVVTVGEPMEPSQVQALDDDQLIGELQRRMRGCFRDACERRRKSLRGRP
jgi:1-acyl-sn-glycerol-3-phosphate acyltransferase